MTAQSMISDETKAAIVKKASAPKDASGGGAGGMTPVVPASTRTGQIGSAAEALTNLQIMADAAAVAEPSTVVAAGTNESVLLQCGVSGAHAAECGFSAAAAECAAPHTPALHTASDPRIADAVHRLETLMRPVVGAAGTAADKDGVNAPTGLAAPTSTSTFARHQHVKTAPVALGAQNHHPHQLQRHSQQPPNSPHFGTASLKLPKSSQHTPLIGVPHISQQPISITHPPKHQQLSPNLSSVASSLNMTAIATQLHMNPTLIPAPQSYVHPTLGPSVSWTASILSECGFDPTSPSDLTDAHRRAFTQCDAVILAAIKERNQFLEIGQALVAECGKYREIGNKYLGILRQLIGIVPPNVQIGVRMDLEAIERFARSESAIAASQIQHAKILRIHKPSQNNPQRTHQNLAAASQPLQIEQADNNSIPNAQVSLTNNDKRPLSPTLSRRGSGGLEKRLKLHDSLSHIASASKSPENIDDNPTGSAVEGSTILRSDSFGSASSNSSTFLSVSKPLLSTLHQVPHHPRPSSDTRKNLLPSIMQVNPPREYVATTRILPAEQVCAMALSRPFKYLFTASTNTIKIWDVAVSLNDAPRVGIIELNKEQGSIRALRITPDGKTLIAAGDGQDASVCNINTVTPHVISRIPTSGSDTYTLAATHDSAHVLVGGRDGTVKMWDIAGAALLQPAFMLAFVGHDGAVTCCCISRDGKKLYSGSRDKTVRLWDMLSGQCLKIFGFPSQVHTFDLNPLIPILTVGLEDGIVQKFLTRPTSRQGTNGPDPKEPFDSPTEDELVYLEVPTGKHEEDMDLGIANDVIPKKELVKSPWGCVKYSRSGLWFVAASSSGRLCVFKESNVGGTTGKDSKASCVCQIAEDCNPIICAEVSACGNFVVSDAASVYVILTTSRQVTATNDKQIRVFAVSSEKD
ncbi:Transducin-like enhancer protein 4 [Entophlyctis luteolus]|nr:Transducin-like enhancer protein 4 [Entophlyctis luteolus]